MTVNFQASLFDVADPRGTTGAVAVGEPPALGRLGDTVCRHVLGRGAWVDVGPGWVTGSDELFACLVQTVPWRAALGETRD